MKAVFVALFAGMIGCALVQPVSAADAVTYREKVLWSFGSGTDGQYPYASLINVNGTLYGTTSGGGSNTSCDLGNGCGTVFSLDPSTDVEKVLYSFCSQSNCTDGANPADSLINVKGTLYGTTVYGGSTGCSGYGCGTVFSLDPNTGAENVLYAFCTKLNCPDGAFPLANLIHMNGKLYGTTDEGGNASYLGTAFALDRKTGAETVLYSFCSQQNCTDGQNPGPALIDVNGTLYGTTAAGGSYDCGNGPSCGTAFSLDPSSGTETVLHSFGNGTDGANPSASLIDVTGILYGTTYVGGGTGCGGYGCGTVFSLDPSTGTETVLHSFGNGTDGANPSASLIDVKGTLYGTTSTGGGTGCHGYGCGTVFSLDPSTGAETVLYSFCSRRNCTDGANPYASLTAVNGKFYGTTEGGGAYGYGTVFVLKKKR